MTHTPNQQAEREAFEAWIAGDSTLSTERDSHGYSDFSTELMWHSWQARAALSAAPEQGTWVAAASVAELTRRLDVALNGEAGAAPAASLCDVVGQAEDAARRVGRPLLALSAAPVAQSVEQSLRDALAAMGSKHAQDLSAGDLMALVCQADELPAPVAVPEGYVLVPVQLTPEMRRAYNAYTHLPKGVIASGDVTWAAMLSAAPTPQPFGIAPVTSRDMRADPDSLRARLETWPRDERIAFFGDLFAGPTPQPSDAELDALMPREEAKSGPGGYPLWGRYRVRQAMRAALAKFGGGNA